MPISTNSLKSRKLPREESYKSSQKAVKKAQEASDNRWLAEQFIDPETKEPIIDIGEAIAIGGFEDEVTGKNWVTRHMPGAVEILAKETKWVESTTKNGRRPVTYSIETHPEDGTGTFEVWIFRTKK
jgi:hypothetical protein